jgi:hypothetical protein
MGDNMRPFNPESIGLENLSCKQAKMIDEALDAVGKFGEVRLIIEKGRLRFLVTQKSFDALKYHPGSITEDS